VISALVAILARNPLLLLFLVAAVGYPLGRIRLRGSELGVAAVLFVGLGAGALDASLVLPDIVYMLGLAIFVYSVGLASGRAFVASLRRDGLRDSLVAVGAAALSALGAQVVRIVFDLDPGSTAGLFAGAQTNTPALAAAVEALRSGAAGRTVSEPVVAYSICYPMGVIGVVLAIRLAWILFRPDLAAEGTRLAELGAANAPISSASVRVERDLGELGVEELRRGLAWKVIFGRLRRAGEMSLVTPETRLLVGDVVTVVGTEAEIAKVLPRLGVVSPERIDLDRRDFDLRRIFVSNAEVAGRPLRDLDLHRKLGAVITRVRRGDVDLLPADDMRLEIGDRVRVLAPAGQLPAVTAFFGDSYRAASEVDVLTFGLGLALGLALGLVPIPLPGGMTVSLGFAGGPLVVALVLGTLDRAGGRLWNLPFGASVALRQLGLVLFLAGIGTRAGSGFLAAFASGGHWLVLLASGALITFVSAFVTVAVAHRLLGIPMSLVLGMVAGVHTQPAVLGYALERTRNDIPSLGYASTYPAATLAKLVLVQILVTL